jgi:membrane associated rhomboid family serine protease
VRPPESWRSARVTLAIAAITAAAWLIVSTLGLDALAAQSGGFIPADVGRFDRYDAAALTLLTPITATLVHANGIHIVFNLLILLFCGRAVETILGARGLIVLYLVGAYASAAAQWALDPSSTVPMVGASGAISAVLGAYAMLFGRNRVKLANPALALWLNALWLAVTWVALQLLIGFTFRGMGMLVAIGAHIGGFFAGLMLTKPLLLLRYRGA